MIEKILKHLGLEPQPPPNGPARQADEVLLMVLDTPDVEAALFGPTACPRVCARVVKGKSSST